MRMIGTRKILLDRMFPTNQDAGLARHFSYAVRQEGIGRRLVLVSQHVAVGKVARPSLAPLQTMKRPPLKLAVESLVGRVTR
jgi:hypothetical protein